MARKKRESHSPFQAHQKELALAYKRINGSPSRRLQWLLNFAQEDWNALSRGQLSDRRYELIMFVSEGVKPEQLSTRSPMLQDMIAPLLEESESKLGPGEKSTLEIFHTRIKRGFADFFSSSGWGHEATPIKTRIAFAGGAAEIEGSVDTLAYFVEIAFNLVRSHLYRIHRCANEKCGKPFVEKRAGRAKFCSRQCQAYVKLKNWRARKE